MAHATISVLNDWHGVVAADVNTGRYNDSDAAAAGRLWTAYWLGATNGLWTADGLRAAHRFATRWRAFIFVTAEQVKQTGVCRIRRAGERNGSQGQQHE